MFQAGTKAKLALYAVLAICPFLTPQEASASVLAAPQQVTGTVITVEKSALASDGLTALVSPVKITSFKDQRAFLANLRSVEYSLRADKATYATAKENELVVQGEAVEASESAKKTILYSVQAQVEAVEVTPSPFTQPSQVDTASYVLNADRIFDMLNATRASAGLSPLQRDASLADIARSRGPELFDEIFVNGNMHAGFHARNLPYWATENIIYYNTEEGAVNWWMNSPVHRAAIMGDYQFAGIACEGKACSMIFSNFVAK